MEPITLPTIQLIPDDCDDVPSVAEKQTPETMFGNTQPETDNPLTLLQLKFFEGGSICNITLETFGCVNESGVHVLSSQETCVLECSSNSCMNAVCVYYLVVML